MEIFFKQKHKRKHTDLIQQNLSLDYFEVMYHFPSKFGILMRKVETLATMQGPVHLGELHQICTKDILKN